MGKMAAWSQTPALNNATPPFGWPEFMQPSAVNNTARQMMASLRQWYDDAEWIEPGDTAVTLSSQVISVVGDRTAVYRAGRAIRLNGTLVGTMSAVSLFAGNTLVTLSGITAPVTITQVEYGILSQALSSALVNLPGLQGLTVADTLPHVDGFAALRALSVPVVIGSQTLAYQVLEPLLGGVFEWDAASSAADDNLDVIAPASAPATGRYLRAVNADVANARAAAVAAQIARTGAEAAYDSFDDRYLGVKAADPTTDNDGDPLQDGAFYLSSVTGAFRFYFGGSFFNPAQISDALRADLLAPPGSTRVGYPKPEGGITTVGGRLDSLYGSNGAYLIGKAVSRVENVSELSALSLLRDGDIVYMAGYYSTAAQFEADGGGGFLVYRATSSATVTGCKVFAAPTGLPGRFHRVLPDKKRGSILLAGAKGDGSFDDAPATIAAIAAFSTVDIPDPSVAWIWATSFTVPTNKKLQGSNKHTTVILKGAADTVVTLATGASISDLTYDGQGATWSTNSTYASSTAGGMLIAATSSKQAITRCRIVNHVGPAIDFADNLAGSQFSCIDSELWCYQGVTGSDFYAVRIPDTQTLQAVPRKFSMIETAGFCSFNWGGCNDCFLNDSFIADMRYTLDTRGVQMTTTRLANQAVLTFDGHNNTIVACALNPYVIVNINCDNCAIYSNSYNRFSPPTGTNQIIANIVDNSGNNRNNFEIKNGTYTPVFTSGGTAFALGNGTLTGKFTRNGNYIRYDANLVIGSTTTVGTGGYSISLPQTRSNTQVGYDGTVALNPSGTNYRASLQHASGAGVTTAELIRDTTGSVTFNSPGTLVADNFIRMSGGYEL